jgi:hypothetical protein
MIASLEAAASLRLPSRPAESMTALSPEELRATLQQLSQNGFSGRFDLRSDHWQAQVLVREGQALAAALAGPDLEQPLLAQQALAGLFTREAACWSLDVARLDALSIAALAGSGSKPEERHASSSEDLRFLLRGLAEGGQDGLLELDAGQRWARILIANGRILGSYSESDSDLANSLTPVGAALGGPPPAIRWYPSAEAIPLAWPKISLDLIAGAVEVERQVVWITSRFEAAWGRARERVQSVDALEEALRHMLGSLRALASALESTAGDAAALEAALDQPMTDSIPRDQLGALDERLEKAGPRESCPILVELVADVLRRIVQGCPDAHLAEYCRQVAQTLDGELRSATRPDFVPGAVAG